MHLLYTTNVNPPPNSIHSSAVFVLIFNPLSPHCLNQTCLICHSVSAPLLCILHVSWLFTCCQCFKIHVQINVYSLVLHVCIVGWSLFLVQLNDAEFYVLSVLMFHLHLLWHKPQVYANFFYTKILNNDMFFSPHYVFLLLCSFITSYNIK